jgi:hypothetical protein
LEKYQYSIKLNNIEKIPIIILRNLYLQNVVMAHDFRIRSYIKIELKQLPLQSCGMEQTVFLPKITLIRFDYHFKFKRLQFPVKVCFAVTINKVQVIKKDSF